MPITLTKELRNKLAKATSSARVLAESACRAALENLAVHEKDYRSHMTVEQRQLRNQLRARGRALGDRREITSGTQEIRHLTEAAAYEHWHRLLFTRFLADNNLLHTDEEHGNVPVTLKDCDELAPNLGARDGFDLACRFAGKILPGVFRSDDPVLEMRLARNDEVELKKLLDSLPLEIFTADDSLGWTYQFWQAQRKEEINKSGKKIGADELSAVTQLFTEDYMVEFLLHNTLGAWWAGKLGPIFAQNEEEARAQTSLPIKDGLGVDWTYLRFIQDEESKTWAPAAGAFSDWPTEAKLIKFLDPCMGSGHFLVFALPLIARMRMEEEGLIAMEAIRATLSDNMFGLELDERCSQIAAFNLALTAWKIGGYQQLPPPHLACSGLAPNASEKDWVALAGDDERLKNGMMRLYELFKNAPVLGSLINPLAQGRTLLEADFQDLQPLLERALKQEVKDDNAHEMTLTANGIAKAAEILADHFTLVATNVPYLGRGKQDKTLQEYCEHVHPEAKADLATCFLERCWHFSVAGGSNILVTPQNWLFLGTYRRLRETLLKSARWNTVTKLGSNAFQDMNWWAATTALIGFSKGFPDNDQQIVGIDVSETKAQLDKALGLASKQVAVAKQRAQMENPDARINLEAQEQQTLLMQFATGVQGLATHDDRRFACVFWEFSSIRNPWECLAGTVEESMHYGGRTYVFKWGGGEGEYKENALALKAEGRLGGWKSGKEAWGKLGVSVSQMRILPCTLYTGDFFDHSAAAVIPQDSATLPAVWCFCSSPEFHSEVRKIDQAVKVTNASLVKIPFDLVHWQNVAAKKYPDGLPKPFSSDPTQWLFNGHPKGSDQPLHVAGARLLGYQWPRQTGSDFPDCPTLGPDGLDPLADADGIVCLPPINREQPAANRLRTLLVQALGPFDERTLVATAGKKGSKSATLEDWLREEFFEQHCELFQNRPFIWHVWDGRKDGFHALVNYHKLDHAGLQKLTYSYLGDWIRQQEEDAKADKPGADLRLGAARILQAELARILGGEAPYDIFIRWKPISKQPVGWNPDINDGVRMNIRPFIMATDVGKKGAGILKIRPGVKWEKDRGKEPHRDKVEFPWFWCEEEPRTDPVPGKSHTGHRWNNVHLTLAAKGQ